MNSIQRRILTLVAMHPGADTRADIITVLAEECITSRQRIAGNLGVLVRNERVSITTLVPGAQSKAFLL